MPVSTPPPSWASIKNKPTTIQGLGITDNINQGASVASTSGSAIDFLSIPSWVKRITILFNGVSFTGTNWLTVQAGTAGGIASTGYVSGANVGITTGGATDRFVLNSTSAATDTRQGIATLCHMGGNVWAFSSVTAWNSGSSTGAGVVTLGGTLDRVRILPFGADTFDAGSINIMYE